MGFAFFVRGERFLFFIIIYLYTCDIHYTGVFFVVVLPVSSLSLSVCLCLCLCLSVCLTPPLSLSPSPLSLSPSPLSLSPLSYFVPLSPPPLSLRPSFCRVSSAVLLNLIYILKEYKLYVYARGGGGGGGE